MTKHSSLMASVLLGAATALLSTFTPARAGVLAAINYANYQQYSDAGLHPLKLAAGGTSVPFKTTVAKQIVVFTFHARCDTVSTGAGWIVLTMRVDGKSIEVGGPGGQPVCYAQNGNSGETTRVLAYQVPAIGTHSFTIDSGAYYLSSYTFGPTTVAIAW